MRKSLLLLIIFISAPLVTGSGYIGNLPQFGEKSSDGQQRDKTEVFGGQNILPFQPLAPKVFPASYDIIMNQGRYSDYMKDLKEILPFLERLKQIIDSDDRNKLQLFTAKSNIIELYIDSFSKKYANKPESYYDSYKQLIILDQYLNEICIYWHASEKYKRIAGSSLRNRKDNKKFI